ncbi:MAG: AAA family ATPase [Candidatus Bathyarchaeota archaeon]|nr:AAA family ATPase [Candidatus Bathyarchaeota archaeon]
MPENKQKISEKPMETSAVGFGFQGGKKKRSEAVYMVEEQVRTELKDTKLSVSITKAANLDSPSHAELRKKYRIDKYDLHPGYVFPESQQTLIPRNTPEYIDKGFNYVERIVRALYHFKQCALIGPSGTGKTHIVYLVAELCGLPMWEINCGLQTSAYDLFGRYIGLGKENWIDGQIVMWCRNGGILYLDEANMMKQDIATRLNPVLDTRGHIVLTEKDNEIIKRHQYGYLVISMNPFSAEFVGTKPLNAALRRRMSVWINFDYLSIGDKVAPDEVELIAKRSGVDEKTAEKIVRVGAELRRQYKNGDLPYGPSPGDLINWATLVADGCPPIEAAVETIVGTTSDDVEIQAVVKRIVESIFEK